MDAPRAEDATAEPSPRRRGRPPLAAVLAMVALAAPLVVFPGRAPRPTGPGPGSGGPSRVGALAAPTGPALPAPSVGSGALTLTGLVVDTAGDPVADVAISAELELPAGDRALAPGAPVPAGAPDAAPPPPIVVANADAAGRFALAGLVGGRHRLTVEGPDIFTAEVRFVAVPSDDVRVIVARRVAIAGSVVDNGEPVEGATVELAGDSLPDRRQAVTGADGTFTFAELPEGTFQVWAWRGDLAARTHRVPRLGAGPFSPAVLVLEPGAIVTGRVVDRDTGAGVAAAIELRPIDAGPDEAARYARSGTDGAFRIDGVPRGRWLTDAWSPGWVSAGTVELEAGRGAPTIELVAGGVIEGTVVDDAGAPIAGATVRAMGESAATAASARDELERLRRYSGWSTTLVAPASDAAAAPTADPQFVPRGELGVLLGPIPFPPPPGARVLRQAAIVTGLRGAPPEAGEPAPIPVDPDRAAIWRSGPDGHFRITGLPRGRVVVFAEAPGLAEGAAGPLATAPGRTTAGVTVALTVGAVLIGRVTDQRGTPVIGASIAVSPQGTDDPARRRETVTDATGEFRIGPLAGAVTAVATAYAHGEARAEVELPRPAAGATAPVELRRDLVLVVADAVLVGTVDDAAGLPVRGATVAVAAGPAAGRSAVTDAAGFRIELLPPGALRVRIDHPDYPLAEVATSTEDGVVHLVLPWGGGADGQVIDHHTGAVVPGVVVSAAGPSGARDQAAADATGRYELGPLVPGTWTVTVAVPGYLPAERTIEVPRGDRAGAITVRDLRLELERGAKLAGMARDRYGTRVAGATITATRQAGDGAVTTTRTDADGLFHLQDAPTGPLVVRGEKDGLTGALEVTVSPGDELTTLYIELR